WLDMLQRLQRIDAVLVGHRYVQQNDVKIAGADGRDRFAAARGFCGYFHIGLIGDELLKAGSHDGVVVSDEDPDHWKGIRGMSGPSILSRQTRGLQCRDLRFTR